MSGHVCFHNVSRQTLFLIDGACLAVASDRQAALFSCGNYGRKLRRILLAELSISFYYNSNVFKMQAKPEIHDKPAFYKIITAVFVHRPIFDGGLKSTTLRKKPNCYTIGGTLWPQ